MAEHCSYASGPVRIRRIRARASPAERRGIWSVRRSCARLALASSTLPGKARGIHVGHREPLSARILRSCTWLRTQHGFLGRSNCLHIPDATSLVQTPDRVAGPHRDPWRTRILRELRTLNLVLALLGVELIDVGKPILLSFRSNRVFDYRELAPVAIVLASGASLLPGILYLRHLQKIGQLYYGGHSGLLSDTVGSTASQFFMRVRMSTGMAEQREDDCHGRRSARCRMGGISFGAPSALAQPRASEHNVRNRRPRRRP